MALVSKTPNHSKEKCEEARILLPCVYSMFLIIYYSTLCTFVTVWFNSNVEHL